MSVPYPEHYKCWITTDNFKAFVSLAQFNDLSKATNRISLLTFLSQKVIYYNSTTKGLVSLHQAKIFTPYLDIIGFLQKPWLVDYENSKGNRTEHLNIEFQKALDSFWKNLKYIIENLVLKYE